MEHQIKTILKQKGMTQKELAERMGMSLQQLNNTISGRNTASMAVYERIAKELDVEFWRMFAPDDVLSILEIVGKYWKVSGQLLDNYWTKDVTCYPRGRQATVQ